MTRAGTICCQIPMHSCMAGGSSHAWDPQNEYAQLPCGRAIQAAGIRHRLPCTLAQTSGAREGGDLGLSNAHLCVLKSFITCCLCLLRRVEQKGWSFVSIKFLCLFILYVLTRHTARHCCGCRVSNNSWNSPMQRNQDAGG